MDGMPIILVLTCALASVLAANPKAAALLVFGGLGLLGLYYAAQTWLVSLPSGYAVVGIIGALCGAGLTVVLTRR